MRLAMPIITMHDDHAPSLFPSLIHLPGIIQLLEIPPPILRPKIFLLEPVPPIHSVPPIPGPYPIPIRPRRPHIQRLPRHALPGLPLRQKPRRRIIPPLPLPQPLIHLLIVRVPRQRHELRFREVLFALPRRRQLDIPLLGLRGGGRFGGVVVRFFARLGAFHGHVDDAAAGVAVDGFAAAAAVRGAVLQEAGPFGGALMRELLRYLRGGLQAGVGAGFHARGRGDGGEVFVGEGAGVGFGGGGGDDGVGGGLVGGGGGGGRVGGAVDGLPVVAFGFAEFGGVAADWGWGG